MKAIRNIYLPAETKVGDIITFRDIKWRVLSLGDITSSAYFTNVRYAKIEEV